MSIDCNELKFIPEKAFSNFNSSDEKASIKVVVNELIELSSDEDVDGITYAVTGDWGSGKTSYLKNIEKELADNDYTDKSCKTFFYEAWKYQNDNVEPIISLLNLIISELNSVKEESLDKQTIKQKILTSTYKIGKTIALASTDILVKTLTNNTVDMKYASQILTEIEKLEAQKYSIDLGLVDKNSKLLRTLIEDTKEYFEKDKIVIFIDDVDRVIPKKAFDIIDSIRFYLRNIKDVIVIFGINSRVISKYVEKNYSLKDKEEEESKSHHNIFSGEEFIEKLFDTREVLEPKAYESVYKVYKFPCIVNNIEILRKLDHLPYRKWRLLFNNMLKEFRIQGSKLSIHKTLTIIFEECYPRFNFHFRQYIPDSEMDNVEEFLKNIENKITLKESLLDNLIKEDCANFTYLASNILTQDIKKFLEKK